MEQTHEENGVLDYDGEISQDGEGGFTVLPDGDEVTFTVRKVEKGRNKDGTLPQVKVEMSCQSKAGHGRTSINEFFTMTRKSEWKLCEFFTSIGLRKHGDRLKMRWDIEGMTGSGKVTVEQFTKRDGSAGSGNRIKRFLEPDVVETPAGEEPAFT